MLTELSDVNEVRHDFRALRSEFQNVEPFNHVVIDEFFPHEFALALANEFPDLENPRWDGYNNSLEIKKLCNFWNRFQINTYRAMAYLNAPGFVARVSDLVGEPLYPDYGLNGGGQHTHGPGGKINVHLDYSVHPKLGLERRLSMIIYLTPGWAVEWGGSLQLWTHNAERNAPGELAKEVECRFNRAVIFDTSQNSWHGLPAGLTCPPGVQRNSLAVYYLCEPRPAVNTRGRALYAPYRDQKDDPAVLDLIRRRSEVTTSAEVYEIGPVTAAPSLDAHFVASENSSHN